MVSSDCGPFGVLVEDEAAASVVVVHRLANSAVAFMPHTVRDALWGNS